MMNLSCETHIFGMIICNPYNRDCFYIYRKKVMYKYKPHLFSKVQSKIPRYSWVFTKHFNVWWSDSSQISKLHTTSTSKAPAIRSQHVNATYPNIVDVLLGATCCVRLATLLRHVGCWWLKFDHFQTWANNTQHRSQHDGQTHSTCCALKCCDMLRWHVAIFWPGLKQVSTLLYRFTSLRISTPWSVSKWQSWDHRGSILGEVWCLLYLFFFPNSCFHYGCGLYHMDFYGILNTCHGF